METVVECTVSSKKETRHWSVGNPLNTALELEVPYDEKSVFYKMSGGSNFLLNTTNQSVADMFKVGDKVRVTISKI